jgi:CheY-like chemotaxis protein
VLVVEDNVFFREVFTENFKERFPDLIVEVAANGNEALQKATAHPPDLIVLDIELGG